MISFQNLKISQYANTIADFIEIIIIFQSDIDALMGNWTEESLIGKVIVDHVSLFHSLNFAVIFRIRKPWNPLLEWLIFLDLANTKAHR